MVKLGTHLPEHLLGTDHGALREFLVAIDELGYSYITCGDHVLGAELTSRPDWRPYFARAPIYDERHAFHEPLIVFALLTGLGSTLELATGILISAQRQTALLAKQAAEVDFLSGGRVRLVIATGWNDVEYEALGVEFAARGKIIEEQVELLRRLWSEPVVTYTGQHHTVNAAGINPRPVQQPIPLWFGGATKPVLRRAGRMADGWFPSYPYFDEAAVRADIDLMHQTAREAGRNPDEIGIEAMIMYHDERFERPSAAELPPKTIDECVHYAQRWKALGATHFFATTPWVGAGAEDIAMRPPGKQAAALDERVRALGEFAKALGNDF